MTHQSTWSIAGASHVGMQRRRNEDAILVDDDLRLYVVADGMGGHGAGEVASQLAIDSLHNHVRGSQSAIANAAASAMEDQALEMMHSGISISNQAVYERNAAHGHTDGTGMGTTLVGLYLLPYAEPSQETLNGSGTRAVIFNIGDSRVYEYNQSEMVQLTHDHTMFREWEDGGRVGPAPPRNIILRAIGLFDNVDIDAQVVTLNPGSTYLICSDGLTDMLSDKDIVAAMGQNHSVNDLNDALIARANDHGGVDNISVISVKSPS